LTSQNSTAPTLVSVTQVKAKHKFQLVVRWIPARLVGCWNGSICPKCFFELAQMLLYLLQWPIWQFTETQNKKWKLAVP